MSTLWLLKKAIEEQHSISFKYNKPWKVQWVRIWDPYAIYIFTAKSWEQSTKVHLVQTAGVSDTTPPEFPDFRNFNILDLSEVVILEEKISCPLNDKYNPESKMYDNIICKL